MVEPEVREIEAPTQAGSDLIMSLSAFAVTLRPVIRRDARGRPAGVASAGHPDEIWLKYLSRRHGAEKHTSAEWSALIDSHRDEPAHPAGIGA